ncbi:MAG: T9SS C-terminal target domain-containing protein [Stygiobacter sp.]|nr:MAG: T9SS C-terminal target domain-containing protein [Stygiobacter sp.]
MIQNLENTIMTRIKYLFLVVFVALTSQVISQTHFTPVWSGSPTQAMNIFLTSATYSGSQLSSGDEVAVFDGSLCVGVTKLIGPVSTYVEIRVSADNSLTTEIDGFTNGHAISYKLWKASLSTEVSNPTITYDPASSSTVFTFMGTAFVNLQFTAISQPILNVSPDYQTVTSNAGSTSFTVSNTGSGTMNWTATSNSTSWLTVTSGSSGINTGNFTVDYTANNTGATRTGTITVTASGTTGSPKTVEVRQAGGSPNGPVFTTTPPAAVTIAENTTYTFNFAAQDQGANPSTIVYSIQGTAPSNTTINTSTGAFVFAPNYTQGRTTPYSITVRAAKSNDATSYAECTFNVTVTNVNRSPVFTTTGSVATASGKYGVAYNFTYLATDADEEVLTYAVSISPVPSGAFSISNTFGSVGLFTFTPTFADDAKVFIVTVTATDPNAAVAITTTSLTIISSPTITVNIPTLSFGDVLVNTNSSPKSYIISGSNLSSNITIEAPSSFQISINETFGFGSSITLNPTNGTVSNTLIWVRFSPATAQSYSGNVINTSSAAITKSVSVSGTGGNKVTTSSNPDNGGTTSGGGIYNSGKNIAVKATSNKGFKFINWTENGFSVSTDSSYQFTMPNNSRALVANFSDGKGNRSPVFLKSMPDTAIYVHNVQVLFKYEYKAVDPDGEAVIFKLDSGPEGATISNTGLFTWIPKTTQAGMQYLLKISISDGTLTQTIITILKTFSTIVGIKDCDFIVPFKFDLEQNYPNPFNPTTKINYQLAQDGLVELKIYDLLGREVAVLLNEFKTAGYYKVDFDANILSSGIYICSLKTNDFSKSIKLILAK